LVGSAKVGKKTSIGMQQSIAGGKIGKGKSVDKKKTRKSLTYRSFW
jgi:hypothetical protein